MDFIANLLSNNGFIMVNKTIIKVLGLHEAIILGELCSEYNYWKTCNKLVDGMFYSTRENIENNTGLSAHYQRNAMNTLENNKILTKIKMGCPAVNYYRINFEQLSTLLTTESLMPLTTRNSQDEQLDTHVININKNNYKNKEKEKPFTKVNGEEDLNSSQGISDFNSNDPNNDIIEKDNVNNDFLGSIRKKEGENPEKKKKTQQSFKDIINEYTDNVELKDAIWTYIKAFNERAREEKKEKGMLPNVLKGQLKQLTAMSKDDAHKIKIMYYSTGYYRPYDPDDNSKTYIKNASTNTEGGKLKSGKKFVNGKVVSMDEEVVKNSDGKPIVF